MSSGSTGVKPFNVLLLGAGPINFGLIDRDQARAERVLTIKRADDNVKTGYEKTKVFGSIDEAAAGLKGEDVPHLAVQGFQANTRGTTLPGQDSEMRLIEHFPNIALLIEKPISDYPDFKEVEQVGKKLKGNVVSVGYMLRYLKAVQAIKESLAWSSDYAAQSVNCGYWHMDREPGPIVTQATHICDLNRYLTPPILFDSIKVNTVESTDPAGKLSLLKFDEQKEIKLENRISKITSASWRYENGGVGSLVHGVCLHEGDYDVELVIVADGWKIKLVDPYGTAPTLYVRQPGSKTEVKTVFTDDDCYLSEVEAIINVVDGKADRSVILSPYEDAIQTYELTWAIRRAGERSYAARRGATQKQ
ncbi:hypothetical protein I316_01422 [Kwoniella heveanensis BCC8398]|uniref:Oxidoreductase putative C-terminal domain-containing protein n=1 Tax=Kwoniella heveanensis BCC8398 TaxID=1296120 RepID=A0A1B9H0M1_9TREE|nr:hypothetical protein I316_01422 [Kwoniella heveanensis BCC8398]